MSRISFRKPGAVQVPFASRSHLRGRRQSGQSMVLVGLLIVVLIGMLALVMDGGYAYLQRRGAQTAADAGALAGARELCRTGDMALATQAAMEYAVTRNRALEADVSIIDGEVEVITRIPFPTYFGRVFGRAAITASAVAAATCFAPGSGTGILPIAWNCPPNKTYTDADGDWNCDMQFGPDNPYIIMNSKKVGEDGTYCMSDGGTVDCDLDNDTYDELLAGGNRSWLDLDGQGSDNGNGSSALVSWIKYGFPQRVTIHTWFAGQPGVSNNVFSSVDSILNNRVILPVYNAISNGLPVNPYDNDSDKTVVSNGASTTYYHVITFSIFRPTCVRNQGSDFCPMYQNFRNAGVLSPEDKTIEGYFENGTIEGLGGQGELFAGAYTIYLTR